MSAIVLLTGATGFVGRATRSRLQEGGWQVRGTGLHNVGGADYAIPLEPSSNWTQVVAGATAVVHLAARTHILNDRALDPLEEFRRTNTAATIALARAAADAGVKRFLFMSSIGVNGPMSLRPLSETDVPHAQTAYAISKFEAEQALVEIGQKTGMAIIVLRPPLTYGPFVKARFLQLMQLVKAGIPLPFGSVRNLRSFVGVDNLADAINLAHMHPAATGKTFFVTDDQPLSTPDLVTAMGRAIGRRARLFSVPVQVLRAAGRVAGKSEEVERLVSSLVSDSSFIRKTLGWSPPKTFEEGLRETAQWLMAQ